MKVGILFPLLIVLGTALSLGISVGMAFLLHGLGHRDTYFYGIWTIPNALIVDISVISFTCTVVVWILLGSLFIACFKLQSGFFHIEPYSIPDFVVGFAKNLSYTLNHTPVFTFNGRKIFSSKALSLMFTKSLFVYLGLFSFVVMPTCTIVTVLREQLIARLSGGLVNHTSVVTPMTCSQMFPAEAAYWKPIDDQHDWDREDVFEALCWEPAKLSRFITIWGAGFGLLISLICLMTVSLQYGRYSKYN
jgi:hypothetical protein